MSTHRYEIVLYWSDTDRAVIAEVPDLPGCVGDGSTYQEAGGVQAVSMGARASKRASSRARSRGSIGAPRGRGAPSRTREGTARKAPCPGSGSAPAPRSWRTRGSVEEPGC